MTLCLHLKQNRGAHIGVGWHSKLGNGDIQARFYMMRYCISGGAIHKHNHTHSQIDGLTHQGLNPWPHDGWMDCSTSWVTAAADTYWLILSCKDCELFFNTQYLSNIIIEMK